MEILSLLSDALAERFERVSVQENQNGEMRIISPRTMKPIFLTSLRTISALLPTIFWSLRDPAASGHRGRSSLPNTVAFVTARFDRGPPTFRRTVSSLAWGSYAWFASEPESLVVFSGRPLQIEGG